MKRLSMALAAAGLMALSACGGGSENKAANTSAEDVNVVEDNLLDESLAGNELRQRSRQRSGCQCRRRQRGRQRPIAFTPLRSP